MTGTATIFAIITFGLLVMIPVGVHVRSKKLTLSAGALCILCGMFAASNPTLALPQAGPTGDRVMARTVVDLPAEINRLSLTLSPQDRVRLSLAMKVLRNSATDRATLPPGALGNSDTPQLLAAVRGRTAHEIIQTADTIRAGVPIR